MTLITWMTLMMIISMISCLCSICLWLCRCIFMKYSYDMTYIIVLLRHNVCIIWWFLWQCVFKTYVVCCICILYMLYTSILCRVMLFDSILDLHIDGSSRDITQLDSDETQPPDVPLDSSDSLLSRRGLVPGSRDWYVTHNTLLRHKTIKGLTLFVCLHHTGLAIDTSSSSYRRQYRHTTGGLYMLERCS